MSSSSSHQILFYWWDSLGLHPEECWMKCGIFSTKWINLIGTGSRYIRANMSCIDEIEQHFQTWMISPFMSFPNLSQRNLQHITFVQLGFAWRFSMLCTGCVLWKNNVTADPKGGWNRLFRALGHWDPKPPESWNLWCYASKKLLCIWCIWCLSNTLQVVLSCLGTTKTFNKSM